MKIPHFQYYLIAPNEAIRASITVRGYVYVLNRARVARDLFVDTEYKLRCR